MDKENEEVRTHAQIYGETLGNAITAMIETVAKTATASAIYSVEKQTGMPMSDEEKDALYKELKTKAIDVFNEEYAE